MKVRDLVTPSRLDAGAGSLLTLQQPDRLLAAMAIATRDLLSATDFDSAVLAALERIGLAAGVSRMKVFLACGDPMADGACHELAYEWHADHLPSQASLGLNAIGNAAARPLLDILCAGCSYWYPLDRVPASLRDAFREMGVRSTGGVPVFAARHYAGLIAFDDCVRQRELSQAEVDALTIAAQAIGGAIHQQRLKREALAAERQRADESARLAALLGQVVNASRTLIDTDLQGFDAAVQDWLGRFARAVGAMRSSVYALAPHGPTGLPGLRRLWQWAGDGAQDCGPSELEARELLDPRAAEVLLSALRTGQFVALQDLLSVRATPAFVQQRGVATVLAVPLFMDGQPWGCLTFDHPLRRDPQPGEIAVLQTAADTLATLLKRNQAMRELLASRERVFAERAAELARANGALRGSTARLAGTGDLPSFLGHVLAETVQSLHAMNAQIFLYDARDGTLSASVGLGSDGLLLPAPGLMAAWPQVARFRADAMQGWARLMCAAAPLSCTGDDQTPEFFPGMLDWHRRQGTQHTMAALMKVGDDVLGMVVLSFGQPQQFREVDCEFVQVFVQHAGLAIHIERLAAAAQRSGEHSAVLAERNRLAREIHDGIGQSFLAIQMQLDALDSQLQALPPVVQAKAMAIHGLAEARRAVSALRPHELLKHDLPTGVRRLLARLTDGTALQVKVDSTPDWQRLPIGVEDHLLRIVQEAVNNALRHAAARTLRVELSQTEGEASVLICDDGKGFDPASLPSGAGFGLESMQQRARLIGGRIDWISQPGKGTQVLVSWTGPEPRR